MTHIRAFICAFMGLALAFLVVPQPAQAQVADTFLVRGVPVDVTAANVAAARQQAMVQGRRLAFEMIEKRLAVSADWSRLPHPSDADIEDIVIDVGVDQEKRSSVRYIATLSVAFKATAIRALLRDAAIPYAEWRGRPVAVLPVWQTDAGPQLWEETNPWRAAWKSAAAQGIVPLVVPQTPRGDALPAQQVSAAGPEVFAQVSQRYATQDVIIAVAVPQKAENGSITVQATLKGAGPVGSMVGGSQSATGAPDETQDAVLNRLVQQIAQGLDESYKTTNLLQFDQSGSLAVSVPLNGGIGDWVAVRGGLARVPQVQSYDVLGLTKTKADLVLHYVGAQDQLGAALMHNGLVLTWDDEHWTLQATTPASAGGLK